MNKMYRHLKQVGRNFANTYNKHKQTSFLETSSFFNYSCMNKQNFSVNKKLKNNFFTKPRFVYQIYRCSSSNFSTAEAVQMSKEVRFFAYLN